ncbi:ACP S-malonyltransferase [Chitinivibrio alkaliphilus]|uniref:[acyl-carrier-protein] S-malonyltransferase n=1 Tax=Chitinivibrio alkaliphilus ACht1 TaxID=1313304 RepID=U7D9I6_9BACT|nr:ACP S-malonyltransferase [Chitinivibrio alkaliphilus]ERP38687.1 (Acyl-carrier-protein) S-malonyltransferase [Chitinivibrio alkaliphilus ACht1]
MGETRIILLPGQGAHFPGMGRDLLSCTASRFPYYLEAASDYAGEDLSRLGEDMDSHSFCRSAYIQPLITAISLAYYALLQDAGVEVDYVLGHSLGEISALGVAGVLSPEETIETAAFRGIHMDQCAAAVTGGMFVPLFLEYDTVAEEIRRLGLDKELYIANINAPQQLVLSGTVRAFDTLAASLERSHTFRTKRLAVNGPWHTPFLEEARAAFIEWAPTRTFHDASIPLIMNATGSCEVSASVICQRIADQLVSPVYWGKCLTSAVDFYGCTTVYELGPGGILKSTLRANGLQKKITSYHSLSTVEALNRFITAQEV